MNKMMIARVAVVCCALLVAALGAPVPLAAEDAKLAALWSDMSDGDRSATTTAAGKVGTILQSVKGSANAKFWGELSGLGMLRNVSLVEIFGEQAADFEKAGLVAFAVTPKGVEGIPGLVEGLAKK
ncbi:MAG: hypothetical protein KJ622_05920 [Alphaproteobacteria bacterium]|nr:hypothetical protein [Alphaproteobacteria bacterium]